MALFRVRHPDGPEATDRGRTHSSAGPKTAWLLGLPALMLLFVPPALGSYTVIVSCSAADARVVKVEVHGIAAPPGDAWVTVTVTGTWRPDAKAPALDATGLNRIPQPKNPYRDTAHPDRTRVR
ncbi:hypothetical protein [Streptomyces violascens]|uniref:Secreted protein n=1 Tax=Streptomyces violascens TaxID=67381 RepID=A0ABQ3QSJ9_9ACTN|nr:hypothetical protein [Streptomyces violascens]GGU33272.1 hypothetical protein GCM10010289_63160 [Streptomyces violascens]GHI40257.1 hypothetical protein Sviol_46650 [Streptomyces violascens]